MAKKKNDLSIDSWYSDIQIKGYILKDIPENKITPEMCFVAVHYWGAALEWVPNKYKTYELCLDAVRHNTPIDEGCSALAFVPNELKTYELCLEAIRHDYLTPVFWESRWSVEWDYAAAINFVPPKLKTPELCFEAVMHAPSSPPGWFSFIVDQTEPESDGQIFMTFSHRKSTSIKKLLNSSKLFIKAVKQIGMPDEYNKDALKYLKKMKREIKGGAAAGPIVSTLAGSGSYGFADGSGAGAQFQKPHGVTVDSVGNVYVADSFNNRIRKISTAGDVSTLAGSGTYGDADGSGAEAQFYGPEGVAVDSGGNVYVADTCNDRIRKISPSGDVSTLAGSGTYGFADGSGAGAQFYGPEGVAVDSGGNVYVADTYNHRIRKISPAGEVRTLAGSAEGFADGSGAGAQFQIPHGVTVDSVGNVYVVDRDNNRIRKISPAGDVSTLAGSGSYGDAEGSGAEAQVRSPSGVAVDSGGNVYVADTCNDRIRKISPSGDVSTLAGSGSYGDADDSDSDGYRYGYGYADGSGAEAQFRSPSGVAVDSAGNVYVADTYNHRIRKVTVGE
jgi:sugar lactone lactonase YvrE